MNIKISGKILSVVLPVYNEELNIESMYNALFEIINQLDAVHEIIFVNDGSSVNSLMILRRIAEKDKNVKVISFTRNFGHQAAITAGLDIASGDCIITMDCDFQDPPENRNPL